MNEINNKEFDGLFARLDDLKKRAVRGEMGISAFFSPRELHYAQAYLRRTGMLFILYGGYGEAERKRVYLLPEYMEAVSDASGLAVYGCECEIRAVKIRGSGFVKLSHRDFMGALLCLGLDRGVIGDIITLDEHSAIAFCEEKIAEFIVSELKNVGRDRVNCSIVDISSDFCYERSFTTLGDTVASARLDCVVASLCKLSREKAQECVAAGKAELDYERCDRPDREVTEGSILSVRGYGKFRIRSIGEQTRKGRYRLVADKFL